MPFHNYPSDLTDEQWALIGPHLPPAPTGGRPRSTDPRDALDAILDIPRAGCQWRYLPKDFPPESTAWMYFNQGRRGGVLDIIHDGLRRKARAAEKPYHPRTAASVDSQSIDASSGGEQRGRDDAKDVDGRKRHIVVDSMGLLLAVLVTAADVDDARVDLPARRSTDERGAPTVRRRQISRRCALRMGGVERELGSEDRPASRGEERPGEAADPLDGRTNIRLAVPLPTSRPGSGEDGLVLRIVRQVGDDPDDGPRAQPGPDRSRVRLPQGGLIHPYETVSYSETRRWRGGRGIFTLRVDRDPPAS